MCEVFIILTILLLVYYIYIQTGSGPSKPRDPSRPGCMILRNSLQNSIQDTLKKTEVMWFFKLGCGYCDRMKDAWNQLKSSGLPSNITLKEINTALPENFAISAEYSISGVPHIVKQKVGSDGQLYIKVYNGDRSMQSMRSWILE